MLEVTDKVPGTLELIEWFGYWPSFHDAEVLDLKLNRTGCSTLRVHTWETTDKVNSRGSFLRTKHIVVSFVLDGIAGLHLNGFSGQNVISGLDLRQTGEVYELTLEPCYGLEGTITADHVQVKFEPGIPADRPDLESPDN
jgi:hypothetical protein